MKYRYIIVVLLAGLLLTGCGLGAKPAEEENQGYDYASGQLNFSVLLNGVGVEVSRVDLRPKNDDAAINGYAYVILTTSIVNESENPVVPGNFVLVDQSGNRYISKQTNVPFADLLLELPLAVDTGDSVSGHQVFEVPNSALGANLRMHWESVLHESQIEIFLGPLAVN